MSTPNQSEEQPASLEDRVNGALDVADDVVNMLPTLAARVAGTENVLREELPKIGKRLKKLEAQLPKSAAVIRRSDYRFESYPPAQDDQELAEQLKRVEQAWQRLGQWVDWLVATYRLTTVVPPCWGEHPTVVEELIGLLVAWAGAWLDTASPEAVVAWHERLARARTRLADGNWGRSRCAGEHDGTGRDLAEQYTTWANSPSKSRALIAARDRAAAAVRQRRATQDGGERL